MADRPRLANREIALLLHVMQRAGLTGRMTLPLSRRAHVPPLWRRHLIEIWYRCVPDEGCSNGPYFNLTVEGYRLGAAMLAARDDRRQRVNRQNETPSIAA